MPVLVLGREEPVRRSPEGRRLDKTWEPRAREGEASKRGAWEGRAWVEQA